MKRFSAAIRLCPLCVILSLLSASACNGNQDEGTPEDSVASAQSEGAVAQPAAPAQPASEPAQAIAVTEAVDTIPWQSAVDYIDEEVFVVGRVAKAGESKSGHVFLNFDKGGRDGLTIFIHRESVKNFPGSPKDMYRGKMIKARGFVYDFEGKPNLSVKEPADIAVMPDDTPLPAASKPAPSPAATIRPEGVIRLASYNVLNLFDGNDDPYSADAVTDSKPRAELEALARSIRRLDADVLAVEEVENRGYLQRFVKVFLPGMGYEVVEFEGNDNRGIDVAVLSRLPVGAVTSHRHVTFEDGQGKVTRFRRDLLQVRIEPKDGASFDVFVIHLKSKGGEAEGGADTRIGEARAIRTVLGNQLKADSKARFVICGDFNDTIDSEPIKLILGDGPEGLIAFVKELPEDGRISYNQPPHLSMIDFIFASPGMAERYVAGSYKIIGGGSPEKTGSDHNPVVAEFKIK